MASTAWRRDGHAQRPARIPQVGWIGPGAAAGNPTEVVGFKQGLRELGYVEGRNIVVEYRFGENHAEPEAKAQLSGFAQVIVAQISHNALKPAAERPPSS